MFKIGAIIVSYNPDDILQKSIERLISINEIHKIIIVDNHSTNVHPYFFEDFKKLSPRIDVVYNKKNLGVATALNIGVKHAQQFDLNWVLTLDQDSILDSDMLPKMIAAFENSPIKSQIGILAPVHYDRQTEYQSKLYRGLIGPYVHRDIVMTSGNLIPMSVFNVVGYFNDDLFIDYVDHEYCFRLKNANMKVLLVADAKISHQLGAIQRHVVGPVHFFSHNYGPIRRYYIARNRIFLFKKFFSWNWFLKDQEFFFKELFKIIFVESNTIQKLKATLLGTIHGFCDIKIDHTKTCKNLEQSSFKMISKGFQNFIKRLYESKYAFNSALNLLGNGLPLVVGLVTIPKIIKLFGVERFGLLSVIWMILGYFSLFDLGLGKTITAYIAQALVKKERHIISKQFWTNMLIIFGVSCIGALIVILLKAFNGEAFMNTSPLLTEEVKDSFISIAIGIPFVALLAGLKGLLEADHKFLELNVLQVILGTYTFISPLFLAPFSLHLNHLVQVIIFGRIIIFIAHWFLCIKYFPEIKKIQFGGRELFEKSLSFGGWLTVSNIISPIMVYFDRFILGAIVPVKEIAFYTAPYEVTSRLSIIPNSITRVAFPKLSQEFAIGKPTSFYKKAFWLNFFIMLTVCSILFLITPLFLNKWLGQEFAEKSTILMRIFCLGIFVNTLAWFPYTWIQSQMRTDITAKLHLFEFPIYLLTLFTFSYRWGLLGAACAWTLRMTIDWLLLMYFEMRMRKSHKHS